MSALSPADRERWLREFAGPWRTNPYQLKYAKTFGGEKVHRPDCPVIRFNERISDALMAGASEAEAGGNVPYPRWVDAPAPTCKVCGGGR